MKNFLIVISVIVGIVVFCFLVLGLTGVFNVFEFKLKKIDDATNYDTIKKVEDTCRAMIASYDADKLAWRMYKDSASAEKQSWAEQAKMRANQTAASYNEYILKNSFIWKENIPPDIASKLDYIGE